MNLALKRVGIERGLPLWTGLALAMLLPAWAYWSGSFAATTTSIAGVEAGNTPGLLRQGLWGGMGSLLMIGAVWRGASAGQLLANRDRSWLTTRLRSAPEAALLLSLGGLLACAFALLGLACGVELSSHLGLEESGPAYGKVHALHGQQLVLVSAAPAERREAAWVVEETRGQLTYRGGDGAPPPQLAFMPTSLAGNGPSALVTISAARIADGRAVAQQTTSLTARVRGPLRVLLPVPEGSGDLLISVFHGEDGPPIRLSAKHSALLEPRSSHALASVVLWQHGLLWIGGAAVLAIGLGALLGAGLGTALTLAIQLVGLSPSVAILGGSAWLEALATAGQGFVPLSWTGAHALGFGLEFFTGSLLLAHAIRIKGIRRRAA
jgi:hypothetical protein